MADKSYSKREQDIMNEGIHEKLDRLIEDIKLSRNERHAFEKSVEPLFQAVSDNSGDIKKLQLSVEEARKASAFINDVLTTWKVTRAVVYFVVSMMLFIIAIKSTIHGGVKDGLNAIKNLF